MEILENPLIAMLITAIIAYLLGSFNSSIIFSKLFMHRDIREIGSGNAGFTNSMRTGNRAIAVCTLIGDVAKVGLAVFIGRLIMAYSLDNAVGATAVAGYISGFFAMLGHIFPVYFGFRGGKGVLTLAAMLLFSDWRVCLISLAVWLICLGISKMVSLSVLITLPIYIFTAWIFRPEGVIEIADLEIPIAFITVGTAILMSVIITIMHKSNIVRILNGTENKIGSKVNVSEVKSDEQ